MIKWIKRLFKPELTPCQKLIGKPFMDSTIHKVTEKWEVACYFVVTKKDYEASLRQANERDESVMVLNWQKLLYQDAEKLINSVIS